MLNSISVKSDMKSRLTWRVEHLKHKSSDVKSRLTWRG
ncbi:hypothetical protein D1AOALGA4SA_1565 [Olavius algarvensis Delta 1 endosymbiont]|nr:hypothetical protein D1AOALGA4SA_1565 [Olavius algarvensis Delta 1 endosymbiont]